MAAAACSLAPRRPGLSAFRSNAVLLAPGLFQDRPGAFSFDFRCGESRQLGNCPRIRRGRPPSAMWFSLEPSNQSTRRASREPRSRISLRWTGLGSNPTPAHDPGGDRSDPKHRRGVASGRSPRSGAANPLRDSAGQSPGDAARSPRSTAPRTPPDPPTRRRNVVPTQRRNSPESLKSDL